MNGRADPPPMRPLKWVGSSKDDPREFPDAVRKEMGHAFYLAQIGMKSPKAKPLRGFGGAGVLEIVEDDDGGTDRSDVELIRDRLRAAQEPS
jgi:phage-related protein